MNKNLIPTYVASSIYKIPLSFYERAKVKYLLLDLDNTLASHRERRADPEAVDWARRVAEAGLTVYIISNNSRKRVETYASSLGVECLYLAFKPFASRLLSFLREKGIRKEDCLLLGDQVYTDVRAANRAGLRSVLLAPISQDDPIWTFYNRRREKRKREEIYARSLATSIKED